MEVAKAAAAEAGAVPETRVYKWRWVILLLFVLIEVFNGVPWSQYTVVADVVTQYYGVDNESVQWTALVYNVTEMVLIIPAAWMLHKYGLRPSMLAAAILTAGGLWLRVLGCWPEHWWAVLAGQAVISSANNFLVSAPPRVAAVWFPASEVSFAVGASYFGTMGGVCIGFLVAPLMARSTWTQEENFTGFLALNLSLAVGSTILAVAVYFMFTQAPALPPSPAQAAATEVTKMGNYFKSVCRILKQPSFLLLLVSSNLIVSVYVAVTTLLNRDIMVYFPDRVAETGYVATLTSLTGMVATLVFGSILDKTKKLKELAIIGYFGGVVSIVMYYICIANSSMEVLYAVSAIMGIFLVSFIVPIIEISVELTYPEPEGNPASLFNWFMQPTSMVAALVYGRIFSAYGPQAAHGMLVGMMVVGFVAQLFIPKHYRRREAELALARSAPPAADKPLPNDAAS